MNGDTQWQKATKSANSGDCVEMRRHNGQIEVRDSKNPTGAVLSLKAGGIQAWIDGAGKGEFDHLA